jgi:hypothetical protein
MYLLNKQFWIATTERAIKTFVQALIAAFGVGQVSGAVGIDVAAIDWRGALSLAFSAALLSVLMSVGSGPIGAINSPSVIRSDGPIPGAAAAIADAVATAVSPAGTTTSTTVRPEPVTGLAATAVTTDTTTKQTVSAAAVAADPVTNEAVVASVAAVDAATGNPAAAAAIAADEATGTPASVIVTPSAPGAPVTSPPAIPAQAPPAQES